MVKVLVEQVMLALVMFAVTPAPEPLATEQVCPVGCAFTVTAKLPLKFTGVVKV